MDNCWQFSGFRKSRFRDDPEKCNFRLQLDCNRMWSVEGFNSHVSIPFEPIVFDHCRFHVAIRPESKVSRSQVTPRNYRDLIRIFPIWLELVIPHISLHITFQQYSKTLDVISPISYRITDTATNRNELSAERVEKY